MNPAITFADPVHAFLNKVYNQGDLVDFRRTTTDPTGKETDGIKGSKKFKIEKSVKAGIVKFSLTDAAAPRASVYYDTYLDMSNRTSGAVATGSSIGQGAFGDGGGQTWSITGTASAVTFASHAKDTTHNLFVKGVKRNRDNSQKGFIFDSNAPMTSCATWFNLFNLAKQKAQICGWFRPNMAFGGATPLYNLITVQFMNPANYQMVKVAIIHINAATQLDVIFKCDTKTSGIIDSPAVTLIRGDWYWYNVRMDVITGIAEMWIYNSAGAIVSHQQTNMGTAPTGVLAQVDFGNKNTGAASGTIEFQDMGMDYTRVDYIPLP